MPEPTVVTAAQIEVTGLTDVPTNPPERFEIMGFAEQTTLPAVRLTEPERTMPPRLSQAVLDTEAPSPSESSPVEAEALPVNERSQPDPVDPLSPRSNPLIKLLQRSRPPSPEALAAQAQQAWETQLQELGRQIQQTRLSKSLSLFEIHQKTQVPIHHLQAIEAGIPERLPEEIYLRGFIRRIGNAIDLDGTQMANSLPSLAPTNHSASTSHKTCLISASRPNSTYLYLGYGAILATGLFWLSQQSPLGTPTQTAPQEGSQTTTAPVQNQNRLSSPNNVRSGSQANVRGSQQKAPMMKQNATSANMAPPESQPMANPLQRDR